MRDLTAATVSRTGRPRSVSSWPNARLVGPSLAEERSSVVYPTCEQEMQSGATAGYAGGGSCGREAHAHGGGTAAGTGRALQTGDLKGDGALQVGQQSPLPYRAGDQQLYNKYAKTAWRARGAQRGHGASHRAVHRRKKESGHQKRMQEGPAQQEKSKAPSHLRQQAACGSAKPFGRQGLR